MQHIAWRWKHCFSKRHFGQASLVHGADICFGASSVIDLCVSGLPMSIEQTERPAESCLSSSPGSLLSLTASTGKYLTWDKFHITGGDLNSLAEMGWSPASFERRNWAETAEAELAARSPHADLRLCSSVFFFQLLYVLYHHDNNILI